MYTQAAVNGYPQPAKKTENEKGNGISVKHNSTPFIYQHHYAIAKIPSKSAKKL